MRISLPLPPHIPSLFRFTSLSLPVSSSFSVSFFLSVSSSLSLFILSKIFAKSEVTTSRVGRGKKLARGERRVNAFMIMMRREGNEEEVIGKSEKCSSMEL